MPSYKPVDFDPFAPTAPSRDVRLKPVDFDPFAKTKPKKKKEDESFLSDVGARFKGGIGSLVSELGLTFKQAANLTKSVPVIGEIDRQVDALLGDYLRKSGEGIKTRAEAELSEASLENQARQQREIAQSDPGMGSKIYSGIGRYLAAPPSTSTKIFSPIDYAINAFARNLLPQTPKEAATQIATVQTAVDTPRSLAETTASMLPATLATVIPGKLVQSGARAILPRLGAEVSEAALNKVVRRGVVGSGATINAASAGSQAYEDVLAKGGTQEEADRAFQIAFSGAAATSAVAAKIPGLEQRVFAGQPVREGILRSAGRAAIGEAPQEFVEEAGSKLATNVAKLGTEAEVPIGEDVMSSGALGAIGGATIAAPIGGLQGVFSGRDAGPAAPASGAAQAPRTPPPPPPPPADMEALAKALGPVGGKVILQEPTGPQEYTFQGFDEDGGVVLADADGVVFSEDPDQVQAAIKAGVAEPESGLGGMAFGMDITEGLDDVFAPPPPPPPPPPPFTEKPKFTIETAEEEATRKAEQAETATVEEIAPQFNSEDGWVELEKTPNQPQQRFERVDTDGIRRVRLKDGTVVADVLKTDYDALDLDGDPLPLQVEKNNITGKVTVSNKETGKSIGDINALLKAGVPVEEAIRRMIDSEGPLPTKAISTTKIGYKRDEPSAAPVQETVQEPELPPPPPERVRTVTTPGGSKVNTAFEVVDAANLTAATGDLQNRDRSRSSTDLQVQDIFAKFDPERLGESLESDRGSPIVGPDNVVESGNGRVLAINKVYDESPEKADAYRKFIEDQGFDISGLDRPVLVRRRIDRMTPDERSKFVRESNMDTKLQLSTSEKAQTDAASLTPDVMSLMASPDVNASTNQGFVRAFLSKLPTQEQAAFLDKDGRLSAEGTRRLRTAVKSSAYGDADLINTLDESQDNNIKSIGGALEDAAPAWRRMLDAIKEGDVEPEMDTTKQLVEAAKIVRDVRNKGMKIGDFLAQNDAFNPLNPVTERFIRSFYNENLGRAAGREAIADVLEKYARRASEQTTSEGLFESESMSPVEILDGILDERGSGAGQSNMFARAEDSSQTTSKKIRTGIAAAAVLTASPVNSAVNDTPIAPNSVLYKSLDNGNTKQAIAWIKKNSKDKDARKIATILAKNGVGEQKTIILDPVSDLEKTSSTLKKNGADNESIGLILLGGVRGMVISSPKDKNIYLIKNDEPASNGVNEQTFLHEAIHAYVKARWSSVGVFNEDNRQVLDDRGLYNEDVAAEVKKFRDMWRDFADVVKEDYYDGAEISSSVISAGESPNEALAYLLTNRNVQEYAKRIVADGRGYRLMSEDEAGKRSWWDDFVDMLRKIFGMGPARSQFFNDFLAAGNKVLVVGEKTKADFQVAAINDESVSPKKVNNNKQAMQTLINGTPDQMRNAVAKAQEPYDKIVNEGADLQKENRGCD